MKRVSLLLLLITVWAYTIAGTITRDVAKEQALQFLNGRNASKAKSMSSTNVNLTEVEGDSALYVFNVGDNSGFVVVSGDDRTEPILGYCDEGSFDPSQAPEALKAMLNSYKAQMTKLTTVSGAKSTTTTTTSETKAAVAPMTSTLWGQGLPYDYMCPMYNGEKCITGCVATSMAQVMYSHQWPQGSTTAIPAYKTRQYKIAVAELPATTFEWDKMNTYYNNTTDSTTAAPVEKLMEYCASAVRMNYGPDGSGAYTEDIAYALINYFGYASTTKLVNRSAYTVNEWDNMIYNELSNGRPVIYDGQNRVEGHSFVCDGYDGNGYYHFNFGWGGLTNGYFKLSVINPFVNGTVFTDCYDGYTEYQDAIVGIQPNTTNETCSANLDVTEIDITDGNTFTRTSKDSDFPTASIYSRYYNYNKETNKYCVSLGLFKNGKMVKLFKEHTCSLDNLSSVYPTDQISFGAGLDNGNYTIVPVCKLSTATEYEPANGSGVKFVKVLISDNTMTLSLPAPVLKVDSLSITGNMKVGTLHQVKVVVTNSGDDSNNILYLLQGTTMVSCVSAQISAGKTDTIVFNFVPGFAGTYNLNVATDNSGTNLLYSQSMLFASADSVAPDLKMTASIFNKSNDVIYGNKFKVKVTTKNNGKEGYDNVIKALAFKSTQNYAIEEQVQQVIIAAGDSVTKTFTFDNLDYGTSYIVNLYYCDGVKNIRGYKTGTYTMTRGMKVWNGDGTVTFTAAADVMTVPEAAMAADMEGMTPTTVTASKNPNCLYIMDEDATTPNGLEGKNIIKGTTADNISLQDGYDFYSPVSFTATNISYSRTFEHGTNGKGCNWSTMVLPFAVTSVLDVNDSKTIDWFHSATDTDKNFWIEEFNTDDENGKIYFTLVDQCKANHPYIVAVPDGTWGEEWNLANKEIRFSTTDANIEAGANCVSSGKAYSFIGSTRGQSLNEVYALNEAGNKFGLCTSATVIAPFRAYFKAVTIETSNNVASLAIAQTATTTSSTVEGTTGIQPIAGNTDLFNNTPIYNISGVMVSNNSNNVNNLNKGIYIVSGRKIAR